ncbi:MAG: hypothetical protein H0T62_10950 [Parachlamydiaceae bacterium]|nr:hypothetical protein [Parachlamydiaceae bacterium]
MQVSMYSNLSCANFESTIDPISPMHNIEFNGGVALDYSLKGNRAYRHIDGSIRIAPKGPGVILGEQLIRPWIDTTYDWSSRTFQMVRLGFYYADDILSRTLNVLPVVQANQAMHQASPQENACKKAIDGCADLLLSDNPNLNPPESLLNLCVDSSPISTPFKTKEEAVNYINVHYPSMNPIVDIGPTCLAQDSIIQIMKFKKPSLSEREELRKVYIELQNLANEDALGKCTPELLEMLSEIDLNGENYFLEALRPLPRFLINLLNKAEKDYTYQDLILLNVKINQISRKMVAQLPNTNEIDSLRCWKVVMKHTAEKNTLNEAIDWKNGLGLFPLTQQLLGICEMGEGSYQLLTETTSFEKLKESVTKIGIGLLYLTPGIGTIYSGKQLVYNYFLKSEFQATVKHKNDYRDCG